MTPSSFFIRILLVINEWEGGHFPTAAYQKRAIRLLFEDCSALWF